MTKRTVLALPLAFVALVVCIAPSTGREEESGGGCRFHRIVEGDGYFRPAWSPDGRRIAFWADHDAGHLALHACLRDGRRNKKLAEVTAHKQRDKYTTLCDVWREPTFLWGRDSDSIYYVSQVCDDEGGGKKEVGTVALAVGLAKYSKGTSKDLAVVECIADTIPRRYVLAPDGKGILIQFLYVRRRRKGEPFVQEKPYDDGQPILEVTSRGKCVWSPDPWKAVASYPRKRLLAAACPTGLWLLDSRLKKKREVTHFPVLTYVTGMRFLDGGKKILLSVRPNWRKRLVEFYVVDIAGGSMDRVDRVFTKPQHLLPLDDSGDSFLLEETVWEGQKWPGRDLRHPARTDLFALEREDGTWRRRGIDFVGGKTPFYFDAPRLSADGRWMAVAGRGLTPEEEKLGGGTSYRAIPNRLILVPLGVDGVITPVELEGGPLARFFLRGIEWHPKRECFLIVTTRKAFRFGPQYNFRAGLGNVDYQFRGEIHVCDVGGVSVVTTPRTEETEGSEDDGSDEKGSDEEGSGRADDSSKSEGASGDDGSRARDDADGSAGGPKESFTNSIGMRFVWIPAGSFEMGTRGEGIAKLAVAFPECARGFAQEKAHRVGITHGFYMSVHEVTNARYEEFNEASSRDPYSDGDDEPVSIVTWPDAVDFCAWLTAKDPSGRRYRLPTEAEWEYAARGGQEGREYPCGDELSRDDACFDGRHTRPVGSFRANGYGLHDMAGNVCEWCSDFYERDYYSRGPARDPCGPDEGSSRVFRGGAWCSDAVGCRVATRMAYGPRVRRRLDCYGIRVVCEVDE